MSYLLIIITAPLALLTSLALAPSQAHSIAGTGVCVHETRQVEVAIAAPTVKLRALGLLRCAALLGTLPLAPPMG